MAIFDKYLVNSFLRTESTTDPLPTAFYSEDFSVSLGDFTTNGDAVWTRVTNEGNGDLFSAVSGNITHKQYSTLQLVKSTTQDSTYLEYDYKTSTEGGYDYLIVMVDDVVQKRYSGTNAWTTDGIFIHGIGSKTIKFVYWKDNSSDGGTDQVWIDNVSLYNVSETAVSNTKTYINSDFNVKGDVTFTGGETHLGETTLNGRLNMTNVNGARMIRIDSNTSGSNITAWNTVGSQAYNLTGANTSVGLTLYNPSTQANIVSLGGNTTTLTGGFLQMPLTNAQFRLGEFAGSDASYIAVINGTTLFRDDLTLEGVPTTSAGSYDILTRNSSTGVLEKISASIPTTVKATRVEDNGNALNTISKLLTLTIGANEMADGDMITWDSKYTINVSASGHHIGVIIDSDSSQGITNPAGTNVTFRGYAIRNGVNLVITQIFESTTSGTSVIYTKSPTFSSSWTFSLSGGGNPQTADYVIMNSGFIKLN